MRGCLFTLALLVVLAAAAVWFALPPLVGTLAQGALVAAGLSADELTVSVSSDPPPKLLTLRADEVRIVASHARYRGLEAAGVDVTLRDVRLADRTFGRIVGSLDLVDLTSAAGGPDLLVPHVGLDGTSKKIRASMTIPAATAEALASTAITRTTGITPGRIAFGAPDRIRIDAGGLQVEARLAVSATGTLTLEPPKGGPIGAVAVFTPAADAPFTLESVRVVDGDLMVIATLDPVPD